MTVRKVVITSFTIDKFKRKKEKKKTTKMNHLTLKIHTIKRQKFIKFKLLNNANKANVKFYIKQSELTYIVSVSWVGPRHLK